MFVLYVVFEILQNPQFIINYIYIVIIGDFVGTVTEHNNLQHSAVTHTGAGQIYLGYVG